MGEGCPTVCGGSEPLEGLSAVGTLRARAEYVRWQPALSTDGMDGLRRRANMKSVRGVNRHHSSVE